jgi:preprotein translocase subunit SecG
MRALLSISLLLAVAVCGPAFAQDSAANASAASGASSEVVTHLTASGVQTALAVSVVPASVVGTVSVVGGVSAVGAGLGVSRAAGNAAAAASGPLKVDDRVVVAADPAPHVPYDVQKPPAK